MNFIVENSNSNYKDTVLKIISDRKKEIFNFFNEEEIDLAFNIYIYDSIENLVDGLRKRGFDNDPDYMCACHKDEDNSLNFFEPKNNPSEKEWSKDEYETKSETKDLIEKNTKRDPQNCCYTIHEGLRYLITA